MLVFLTLLCQPVPLWTFQDTVDHAGRSVLAFRAVETTDTPLHTLHADDRPAAGAKFGIIPLGHREKSPLYLVWQAKEGIVWIDADRDGRYDAKERHSLQDGKLELKVTLATDTSTIERTLLLRRRDDGLVYAVRGYMGGTITLAGKGYSALLFDKNGDGCFDAAGKDRIRIDLNEDGRFDPLTEEFLLGAALQHAGDHHYLRANAAGTRVTVQSRPKETGTVRFHVKHEEDSTVAKLAAHLVSEWGELHEITKAGAALQLPAGKYSFDSLQLTLQDSGKRFWHYSFATDGRFEFEVKAGQERDINLLPDLRAVPGSPGRTNPGERVPVQPNLVTSTGLYMTRASRSYSAEDTWGEDLRAQLELLGPGSKILDQFTSGFH
jgi:hypothetical protein